MKRWITRIAVLAALVGTSAVVVPAMATPAAAHDSWGYSNGCSVPGNPPWRDSPSGVNFHNACDSHDLCYVFHSAGSSEAGRKACDDMFYRLMQQNCYDQVPWWNLTKRTSCLTWAGAYYTAVRAGGSGPFWSNQIGTRSNVPVYRYA